MFLFFLFLRLSKRITAWKVSKYGVFSGPYFPVFWLIYGVNLRIQSEYKKYGPKKTLYLDTFHVVDLVTATTFFFKKKNNFKFRAKFVVFNVSFIEIINIEKAQLWLLRFYGNSFQKKRTEMFSGSLGFHKTFTK